MIYETNCTAITAEKWEQYMKGARPLSKKKAVEAAVSVGIITEQEGKMELKHKYYNPYRPMQTKKHFIYINSAIEYFIIK